MPQHRSPRYPKSHRPSVERSTSAAPRSHRRRRPATRLRGAAARGAAAAGALAVGAVVAGQAVSVMPGGFDPTRYASVVGHLTAEPATTGARVVPVRPDVTVLEPRPAPDAEALAKGVALAERRAQRARAAEQARAEERAARAAARPAPDQAAEDGGDGGGEDCPSSGFNGVEPHVAQAGHHLQQKFGVDDVGGVAERPDNPDSDHPTGHALDFMVDSSTGDALAAYAEEHTEELGIKYILWETENHYDHVHISFEDDAGSGLPC